jgi:outer membrane receptor for ferrienterochelin and colicin
MMKKLLYSLVLVFATVSVFAQVTTSSLSGTIKDAQETLVGASVKAIHTPTGTVYGASTNAGGRFTISNLRVGGPYTIEITYLGYRSYKVTDVFLKLGENLSLSPVLEKSGQQLAEVVVVGTKDNVFNSKRTGAATSVSREQIEKMPTLSRSLQDFTRLTPQASGNSFGGVNNRYNNITIDGAVNNDVFGLASSGTPGGQANTQPISLDAIQEIQVVLAPYDVTLGNFTGGGVNAVTRSGSNKFEGSAYLFGRNQNTIGKDAISGARSTKFMNNQYGFRFGGPIIKDKLFFFVNAELQRVQSPLFSNAGEPGSAISLATAQQIAAQALLMGAAPGYDVGSYGPQDVQTQNNKVFAKFDWNINPKNQLTVRYNYIDAFDDNISRSATSFRFGNNAYKFANKQHVGVLELRTKLNDKFSNNLILGYSMIRDQRKTAGTLFPFIEIRSIDGFSSNTANLGSERSSVANELDQDVLELTDNLKINLGNHNITVGTHNEFFKFRNLFISNYNGRWTYNNMTNFLAGTPDQVQATYSKIAGNAKPDAKFTAAQLGFYVQDEFEAAKGLKLTAGLRMDIPVFGDKPLRNTLVETAFPGYKTDATPSTKPLWSPRLGFNWDVTGDRSVQVRGGSGIFTGRVPFVWLSNQYSNSGMLFNTVNIYRTGTIGTVNPLLQFIADPNNQASAATLYGGAGTTAQVNLVTPNFKMPQVFRNNLAVDFKLPYGINATIEGIYSKTINNVVFADLNLRTPTATIDPNLSGSMDNRPVYSGTKVDGNFTQAFLLSNTNKGYTASITGQLQKTFNFGLSAMVAYTRGRATSVNDGASSVAQSNWEFTQQVNNPNNPDLATSLFQTKHRVIGALNYSLTYGEQKQSTTGISLFYAGRSGQHFTYLYNGDLNNDGAAGNDLIFIPKYQTDIKLVPFYTKNSAGIVSFSATSATPTQQWAALDAFIANDPYLSKHRGEYAKRNGAQMPWENQFDFRITQEFGGIVKGTNNKLQLTFDIFNVGNFLNKNWGKSYTLSNQANSLITYNPTSPSDIGFNFRAPANGLGYTQSRSTWSGQFGVRYIF